MYRKMIFLTSFVLLLGSTANAALYLWNGSAGDGNWDTPANWTVTDSIWTWPNEEAVTAAVADPNVPLKNINSDTTAIDILNGDAVSRTSQLSIQGAADGSTTAVLTLNNASSLTVDGRLAIGGIDGTKGQIDILGGSTVTITGSGNDLRLIDNDNTWATVNIVDSTIDIADDLYIDQVGEAYVNISGNSTVNCDDFGISNNDGSVSFVDISGTTTITIADDFDLDRGQSTVTVGGDAVITFGDDAYVPDDDNGVATLTITDNAVFNIGDDITVADNAGSVGHMIITGNATVNAPDEFYLTDKPTGFATLDVNGTATVNVGDDLDVGEDGPAVCNVGENATVTVGDTIYIPHHEQGIEASMTISGNALVKCDDLQVVNDGGNTGRLHISGNPTIITNEFLMNNDAGNPATSEVIMDGGTVTVKGNSTINDDNPGTATFIMNGGSFHSTGYLNVSDNLDGTAHLTMNGGEMITDDRLRLGKDGGTDIGQVRIFMNGGVLQAEKLDDIKITDTKIIYTGGAFVIGSADVNEVDMQQLITDGTIVADGVYSIATAGNYTVLSTWLPTQAKLPQPFDGAQGVLLGTTVSWAPGTTAATHDVYFGTTNPPPFIRNQAETTYYQPLEVGTTYYWRIDEVEADGTTKHIGDVWSFTTTTDLSTVSEIATQPNPADGALGVAVDATLSWWPGASAVSHDVYFGTTSPPPLVGNTTEFSFDPGPLELSTTYYWRVDAVAADGTVQTGDIWSFQTIVPLPAGWDDLDIGTSGGVTVYESTTDTWTIIADGHDIWGSADGFRYCYQKPTLTRGDCTLIANVVDFPLPDGGHTWQKAGLMIRETLEPGSKNVFVAITGGSGNGATFQWRPETDGSSSSKRTLTGIAPPASIKLVRKGDTFSGYVFLDGQWQQQGETITVVMPDEVYVGLAVTSHQSGVLATAVFDGVSISTPNPYIAGDPVPADGATDVPRMVTLSWVPGATAASHDVYFGDSDPPAFIGNQTETNYSPPGMLDKGKTYYWRIDEVEADGTTKYTGDLWSFTTTTTGR